MPSNQQIKQYAETYVFSFFEDMQDSANQGPKFKWENFPTRVARLVSASIHTHFAKDHVSKEQEGVASEFAKQAACKLIKTLQTPRMRDSTA